VNAQPPTHHPVASRESRTAGGLTVAVGAVHVALTGRDFDLHSLHALWFAGSGLAVMLIGALTLLADQAAAVRWTAVAANLAGLLLAIAFAVLTGFGGPQGILLIALFLAGAASLAATREGRKG
jgi:hypothetical protein